MKTKNGLLFTVGLLACGAASADRVLLDNGDRYSGTVQSLSDNILQLKTDFGVLKLPWNKVTQLHTDHPLRLSLEGGGEVSGSIETHDGRLSFPDNPELAGFSVPLQAVLGVDPIEAPPSLLIEGHLGAGVNVSRGNTENELYHLDAELIARAQRNRYTVSAEGNYGTDGDEQIQGDAGLFARYDHFLSKRWYFNSNASAVHDEFRDLRLRVTLGAGAGYQFQDSAVSRLSAELGISYVHEDFGTAPDAEHPAARWALDYQRQFGDTGLQLFHRHELLASLERVDDTLLRSQTGLRMPLFGRLSGVVQVDYDYDWEPPIGAESADVTYLLKLSYVL